ncbi:conserved hypothetical protein, partial [Ricinus communis]
MPDPVGTDEDAVVAAGQREHERLVDRFVAERDAQRVQGPRAGRIQQQGQRRTLEVALAQQVVVRDRFPAGFRAHEEVVALGRRFEGHGAVAHDGFVARQLQQQRDALRLLLQVLVRAGNGVEAGQPQRDADDDHHDHDLHQGEAAGAARRARGHRHTYVICCPTNRRRHPRRYRPAGRPRPARTRRPRHAGPATGTGTDCPTGPSAVSRGNHLPSSRWRPDR